MLGRPTRLKLRGDLYDVVAAFRQLVVLGEPGAGKTVLAMLFTLGLLDARAPDEPVPVLLPISSWNPPAEHLHTWLTRRLVEDYPALANTDAYGPDAAGRLVHGGRLIPVLDGLDEMPPALHDAAIEALDRAVADSGPLVVTCRSDEYQSPAASSSSPPRRRSAIPAGSQCSTTSVPTPTGRSRRRCPPPLMVYLARIAYADPATSPLSCAIPGVSSTTSPSRNTSSTPTYPASDNG